MSDLIEGSLQVWWIPQVPMNPFMVDVSTPEEGGKILDVLANYDLFQYEKNIKPDYSNAGGLNVFCDGDWEEWYSEFDEDIREYMEASEVIK